MSKSLKLQITAEGVETEEQFAWLRKKGCDLAQGFLFSPGIPMRDFYALYCKNREVGEVGEVDELERTGGDLTETTIANER